MRFLAVVSTISLVSAQIGMPSEDLFEEDMGLEEFVDHSFAADPAVYGSDTVGWAYATTHELPRDVLAALEVRSFRKSANSETSKALPLDGLKANETAVGSLLVDVLL